MPTLKVYIHYEEPSDKEKHMTLKITVPKKWKDGPTQRLVQFFAEQYNAKHADSPLDVERLRITKKVGVPLGGILKDTVQKYDDLYIRQRTNNTTSAIKSSSRGTSKDTLVKTPAVASVQRKKDFDERYNQWDTLVCSSDDDLDCHPNIHKDTWRRLRKQQRKDTRETQDKRLKEIKDMRELCKAEIQDAGETLAQAEPGSLKHTRAKALVAKAKQELETYSKEEITIGKQKKMTLEDVCTVTEERTIVSKDASVKPLLTAPSKDDEQQAYGDFITNHEGKLLEYIKYSERSYRDNKEFLLERVELLCEQCTGWLLLKALEAEMGGNSRLMKQICKQYLQLQTVMDLAKSTRKDPRDFIARFFHNLEGHAKNTEKFMAEVEDFSKKIQKRAVDKAKEEAEKKKKLKDLGIDPDDGEYEYVEMDEGERAGPGGLDPVAVFKTLPKPMQEAFEAQDIPMLQECIKKMSPEDASYHLKRCEDSGLWVPSGGQQQAPVDATNPPSPPGIDK